MTAVVTFRTSRRLVRARADVSGELARRLLEAPDELAATGQPLKDGGRSTVLRIEWAGRPLVLKRYRARGIVHTALHAGLRSKAARCFHFGRTLAAGGIATPRPLAYAERRLGPARLGGDLLTDFVPGRELEDLLGDWHPPADELKRIAAAFAHIWHRLGALRLVHDDLKAANLIWDPEETLWLLDLDGMRRVPPPLRARARREDRRSFMHMWRNHPELAQVFEDAIDRAQDTGPGAVSSVEHAP